MRRGLLGKGALLTVTSQAARTSPVTRGKWFLQTFLGVEPPRSAAGRAERQQRRASDTTGNAKAPTMRQTLEAASHATRRARRATRSSSRWASRSRTSTRSARGGRSTKAQPIDRDRRARRRHEARRRGEPARRRWCAIRDQFVRVVTEKLLTYALGRGVEYQDMPLVRSIVRDAAADELPVLVARAGHRQERRRSR